MITGGTPMTWETSESFCIFLRKHEPRYTRAFSRAGYVTESLPTTSFPAFLRRKKKHRPIIYYIDCIQYTHAHTGQEWISSVIRWELNPKTRKNLIRNIYIYIYIYIFICIAINIYIYIYTYIHI